MEKDLGTSTFLPRLTCFNTLFLTRHRSTTAHSSITSAPPHPHLLSSSGDYSTRTRSLTIARLKKFKLTEITIATKMSGPQCCSNPPALNPSAGAGHVEQFGGLSTYVTGSPDSKRAVILITDVYGYEAPLLRKLADKVAAAGFFVVAPDFFKGDPFVANDANRPIQVWLQEHGPDKAFDDGKTVVEALKNKGISAIGAVGICWGAKVVVALAKVELIQADVLLHPSFVTVDDIKGVKAHTSILGAEIDHLSPPELLKQFEEALSAKPEVDGFVKIFPKVSHGWTVRYNVEDEEAVKRADEAHGDLLAWFTKHLK